MHSSPRRAALGVLSSLLIAAGVFAQQRPQVPGAIRSKVVLVPVDVRVIDKDGNPVTDLTQADFTVLEDGRLQQIGHFSTQDYSSLSLAAEGAIPALRIGPGLEPAAVNQRTFLIVLGRGRLQGPAKGMDALIDFVRTKLLSSDHVAVLAYGRVTELTRDRDKVVRLLERYKTEHPRIEALLEHWFRGLTLSYGGTDAPPRAAAMIASLFAAPGLPASRQLSSPGPTEEGEFEEARRGLMDGLDRNPDSPRDFVYDAAAREDLEKLYGGIEFLRYFEGEKHLIFVSADGMVDLRRAHVDRLASMAADARVTVSPIHTGGVATDWQSFRPPAERYEVMILRGPSAEQMFANGDARAMARQTGGVATLYRYAAEGLDRIERATRFHYLLGYYPSNPTWDGGERRIAVSVNRPGVTVLHRGSYYAREELVPYDRREFLTHSRIAGGAGYRLPIRDIPVTLSASVLSNRHGAWKVRCEVIVDAGMLDFVEAEGRYVLSLDVAVFVGARNQRQVGEVRKRVELKLEPESYARALQEGVKFETMIDLTGLPRYLKAVVYDYAADKLGSAVAEIR